MTKKVKIRFDEASHTYWHKKTELESVSRFIGSYKHEFDKETQSKKYAEKNGLEQKEVLKMWDDKNKMSTKYGHLVHRFMEFMLDDQEYFMFEIEDKKKEVYEATIEKYKIYYKKMKPTQGLLESIAKETVDNLVKFIEALKSKYKVVELEKLVYDLDLRLAGTFDCLVQDRVTKEYVLVDWKTNDEIKFNGFNGQTMLAPLEDLDDCNYSHYCLQLSMYKKMLDKKVSEMYIVHISKNVEMIEVPFLEKECNIICEERRKSFEK